MPNILNLFQLLILIIMMKNWYAQQVGMEEY
jgi:hypothetical protein